MRPARIFNLFIFGPQGSGKGTQAKLLAEALHFRHLSSGEALRATAKKATSLGRYLRRQMRTGSLTPMDKLLEVFDRTIRQTPRNTGIIFDGYARQITEARLIFRRLRKLGRSVDLAILLKISPQETIRRLSRRGQCEACGAVYILGGSRRLGNRCTKCGGVIVARADDTPASIRRRIALYHRLTLPVVRYFQTHGKLASINGEQSIEKVHRDVVAVLKKRGLIL